MSNFTKYKARNANKHLGKGVKKELKELNSQIVGFSNFT